MPLNRVLLASINFDPDGTSDREEEAAHSAVSDESFRMTKRSTRHTSNASPNTAAATQNEGADDEQQNDATKLVISCLKKALARSIRSISYPQKQRPLNPHKDFTIETTIKFKAHRKPNDATAAACCEGRSSGVRNHNPTNLFSMEHDSSNDLAGLGGERGGGGGGDYDDADVIGPSSTTNSTWHQHHRGRKHHLSFAGESAAGENESDDDDDDESGMASTVDFKFIDYSPMCYRHIREFFNVDPMEYCDVLSRSRWHSIPTPGKSAARLFFCGKNWVIKTMTNEESAFLRQILHRYYFHVRDNPYTLLTHFVGHHRLVIGSEAHNIVIMQNVFATTNTMHEKFDLKGSTVGRFASDAEKRRSTCTQKDLDIHSPVHVGPERRQLIIDQIKQDCDFLKGSMIMDYSFLVGIHVLPSGATLGEQANQIIAAHNKNHSGSPLVTSSTNVFNATWPSGFEYGSFSPAHQMNSNNNNYNINRSFAVSHAGAYDPLAGDHDAIIVSGRPAQPLDGRCFTAHDTGMLSNDVPGLRREIYYLGIIDILQEYNTRKTFETLIMGTIHDRERISCVNPQNYAARFISFMSSIIV